MRGSCSELASSALSADRSTAGAGAGAAAVRPSRTSVDGGDGTSAGDAVCEAGSCAAIDAWMAAACSLGPWNHGTVRSSAARIPEDGRIARPRGRSASSATSRMLSRSSDVDVDRTPLLMLAEVFSRS
ncbi:hypothetical protein C5C13_02535 [Clavibacter michiganensis]|nr:hypothetical protein C5C13_02535 [Clavibacter michiganensis]